MLKSERIEELADVLAGNVRGWERGVIERIAKRVKMIGELSPADVKALNNAADIKGDLNAILKELAAMTGHNISELKDMYGAALDEINKANMPLYDYRGKTFLPLADNVPLQSMIFAYAKASGETMLNLSKTSTLCTTDANGNIVSLNKAYHDIIDKAIMQVTSGSGDFHTAMRESIKALGGGGIRVNYGSGITRRLDTVVRQNLMWGAKQASIEYNKAIGEELECDGIEIDWHSNPRPSHEFMQGKQFHVGGTVRINGVIYPDSTEAEERLQDYNCYHYATPIICGVSEPAYSKEELARLNAENAKKYTVRGKTQKGYAWSQDMRKLEAYYRTQQDIKAAAKASGDRELARQCDIKINATLARYKEISDATGIPMDYKRLASVQRKNKR